MAHYGTSAPTQKPQPDSGAPNSPSWASKFWRPLRCSKGTTFLGSQAGRITGIRIRLSKRRIFWVSRNTCTSSTTSFWSAGFLGVFLWYRLYCITFPANVWKGHWSFLANCEQAWKKWFLLFIECTNQRKTLNEWKFWQTNVQPSGAATVTCDSLIVGKSQWLAYLASVPVLCIYISGEFLPSTKSTWEPTTSGAWKPGIVAPLEGLGLDIYIYIFIFIFIYINIYILYIYIYIWPNFCFTNLDFPEIRRFPLLNHPFGGNRSCEFAIIWPGRIAPHKVDIVALINHSHENYPHQK